MSEINLYDTVTDKEFSAFIVNDVTYQEHLHYGMEFVFCLDGEISVGREKETYILHKGEALFFMPYEMHSYKTENNSRVAIAVFSPEFIGEINSGDRFTDNKFIVRELVMDFTVDAIKRNEWTVAECKGVIYPLFMEFLSFNKIIASKNEHNDFVRKSLAYIEEHYHEEIGLQDVSRAIGCHYVHLSRSFSQNTGFSFSTYLNRYRIARSLYLLRNTKDTVTEIAYKCGFGSLRNYNRVFKSYMNQSPKVYRTSEHSVY